MYATVILNTRQGGIGNGLTYALPIDVWNGRPSPSTSLISMPSTRCRGRTGGAPLRTMVGFLVKVPLRKKLVEGIIVDLHEEKPEGDFDVKEIAKILGDEPLLTMSQIAIARWMAEYYLCPLRQAIGVWLPGGTWEKLLPQKEEYIRYTIQLNNIVSKKAGKKQAALIDYLKGKDWVKWKEVKEATGVSRAILKGLVERGVVEMKEERARCFDFAHRVLIGRSGSAQHDITLTPRQAAAHKAIIADPRPTLLFGITGSGKTEIYAALIRDVVNEGRSAILLLPEILLTENFVGRFQQLIDRDAIVVIHSRLTPAQRRDAWRRCREGSMQLVIGSRSALFSPLPNLSLIIIDEEHEWTYKNEQAPRYHAGKVAEYMCHAERSESRPKAGRAESKHVETGNFSSPATCFDSVLDSVALLPRSDSAQHDMKLVLGTATPSVESWSKAKAGGTYQLVELPERFGGASLPSVQIVDLGQVQFGRHYPLSPTLINAIRMRLQRHEQVILFLNRRGFATSLLCMECRHRFEDQETHLPYTVHHAHHEPYLLSHHTGQKLPIPNKCPHCGSANLREVGAGTQKIESIISELFPQARLLRADADTLSSPEKMRTLLETMKDGRADILLGTQSVVKGLDLPKVTLAAVILADVGLSLPHFRAGERVFQLLTQLTGRSGRRDAGEVIIQTFRPKAIEVELASRHDVRAYLEGELAQREKVHYPPDTEMVRFVFSENAEKESGKFVEAMKNRCQVSGVRIHVSRAPSLFGGGKIWQVFLRGKDVRKTLKDLPLFDGVIDVDPIECL